MSGSVWVDPDHLRNQAPRLDELAERTAGILAALRAVIASEGACWGGDETGMAFAGGYLPGAEVGEESIGFAAAAMEQIGTVLLATADAFENTDRTSSAGFDGIS